MLNVKNSATLKILFNNILEALVYYFDLYMANGI